MAQQKSGNNDKEAFRLQDFGFTESQYERPSHKWVCGRASEGRPCAIGPDDQGNCNASVECFPLRKGDRWVCTRDRLRGGSCTDGPLPDGSCSSRVPQCLPVPSLRERRGSLSRWLFISSLAVLLIVLNSSSTGRFNFLSPGMLSAQHGSFTNPCKNCHSASEESPITWIARTAFSPHDKIGESRLCIKCHDYGEHALNAHSMDAKALSDIRASYKNPGDQHSGLFSLALLNFAPAKTDSPDQPLSCAACHREHKGKNVDLKALSDQQCQSCHALKFNRFSDGHPEISGLSFHRRPQIFFDHQSHRKQYYPDEKKYPGEKQEFRCPDCHQVEVGGHRMLGPDFDTGCRTCHIGQIAGEGSDWIGFSVISIPGLDIETLKAREIPVGEWPEYAEKGLTPFMIALLSADPAFEKALPVLQNQADLLDLSKADDAELKSVKDLAWSVKRLIYELDQGGQAVLVTRLRKFFGRDIDDEAMSAIVGGLSAGTIFHARDQWFPNLLAEMRKYDPDALPTAKYTKTPEEDTAENKPSAEADKNTADKETDDSGEFNLDDLEVDASDLNSPDIDTNEFDLSGIDVEEGDEVEQETESPEENRIAENEWVRLGGWYVSNFDLLYRPKGHADGFEKLWLTTSASTFDASTNVGTDLFRKLADPKAPGKCVKCHSIDRSPENIVQINWHGKRSDPELHEFTSFSHRSHLSLIESDGCTTCHSWNENPKEELGKSYEGYDPFAYTSNFSELSKKTCSECHTKDAAGESCLTCHNYHIGKFPNLMFSIKTQ